MGEIYDDLVARTKAAIINEWERISDVPFPLYDQEAQLLAVAAVQVMLNGTADTERAGEK